MYILLFQQDHIQLVPLANQSIFRWTDEYNKIKIQK